MIRTIGSLVLAAAAMGCAGLNLRDAARAEAVTALSCETLEITQLREYAWHFRGCDREISIACASGANEARCLAVRIEGQPTILASVPEETVSDTGSASSGSGTGSGYGTGSGLGSGSGSGTGSATETGSAPVAHPVRDALEARAADVLACTARDRVVVRAGWTADGSVSITLAGELEGTMEEGCVRAALSDLTAPPGRAGALLHLVRRGASSEPAAP